MHVPVLLNEVLDFLAPARGGVFVDATAGCGGHAAEILKRLPPEGILIGIDRDEEALAIAGNRLEAVSPGKSKLVKGNFAEIKFILDKLGIRGINGILFDLGVSSIQLDKGYRGFSILNDGPLDMRMDRSSALTAYDVINRYPERALSDLFWSMGEERQARRIARHVVYARKKKPVETAGELAEIVKKAAWRRGGRQKIHPATRVFQAVRIEVNGELDALKSALQELAGCLVKGARVCVISFHSLEDRIVKHFFRDMSGTGAFRLMNKKPVTAGAEEVENNPRSRSAKLRCAEYLG